MKQLVGGVGFDILEKGWLAERGKSFFGGGMARQYDLEKSPGVSRYGDPLRPRYPSLGIIG